MGFWCNGSTRVFKTFSTRSNRVKLAETLITMKNLTLEEKIVKLRKEGYTYKGIRLKLGNPSNRKISETLNEFCPELAGDSKEWRELQDRIYKHGI